MNGSLAAIDTEQVLLAHGGGGELMNRLIREQFLSVISKTAAESGQVGTGLRRTVSRGSLTDSAVLPWEFDNLVFTTDSYVVTPLEFPGGDIGRLAVCGTVNDLAVMGAEPLAISLGLILEEGLRFETLNRVTRSIADAAREAGVEIVTGDTKVIERRSDTPGLFINTSGVGRLWPGANVGLERVSAGDSILVNGSVAEHGLAIMSVRNGLEFETTLRSDSAPLNHLIGRLLSDGVGLKFCRDATRGGVAGVLADISEASGLSLEIDERRIPITPTARHAAEMLGLDPLAVANEGKAIFVVAGKDCDRALRLIRADDRGRNAAKIGIVSDSQPPLVELITRHAGRRIVQRPYGEELPRIC